MGVLNPARLVATQFTTPPTERVVNGGSWVGWASVPGAGWSFAGNVAAASNETDIAVKAIDLSGSTTAYLRFDVVSATTPSNRGALIVGTSDGIGGFTVIFTSAEDLAVGSYGPLAVTVTPSDPLVGLQAFALHSETGFAVDNLSLMKN